MGRCSRSYDASALALTIEVQVAQDAGGGVSKTAGFRIRNPSFLLHLTIEIEVVLPGGGGTSFVVNSASQSWNLFARSAKADSEVDLNQLVTGNTFPASSSSYGGGDSYEVTSGVKALRGEFVAFSVGDGISSPAQYLVRCTWEPAISGMSPAEFQRLSAGCELSANKMVVL